MMDAQAVQEHVASGCSKCAVSPPDISIADVVSNHGLLESLAASLHVYNTCKKALAQPRRTGAAVVPPDYVRLAKNSVVAVFLASNLCEEQAGYRCG